MRWGGVAGPARPTLAQDAARPPTPHGPGLPAIRDRDTAPWPKASKSVHGETQPSRLACALRWRRAVKPRRLALGTSMDAPAPLTCTDSDRARETSESTRRMDFSERLALTVVPQHFFAARGSTHLSPNIISRDYTGDHRSWWRTTDGWVGKRGSQELWTDRDVAGAAFRGQGGLQGTTHRLSASAGQGTTHRLSASAGRAGFTSPASRAAAFAILLPFTLCTMLAPVRHQRRSRSAAFMLLPPALLAAVFASLCSAPSFLLICARIVLLRCSRRLPRMRVSRVHLRCQRCVFSSNVNSAT